MAFERWTRVYSLSHWGNFLSVVGCFLRHVPGLFLSHALLRPFNIMCIVLGLLLVAFGLASAWWTYQSVQLLNVVVKVNMNANVNVKDEMKGTPGANSWVDDGRWALPWRPPRGRESP